jgi:hypothetical protein
MDLRSAQSHGSWHPLTNLINFARLYDSSECILLPTQSEAFRPLYSTLFHEICHQWCGRTTRLGYFLSRIAADQTIIWNADKHAALRVGPVASRAISAFLPLLEGLALYAQLDFEPPEAGLDDIVPNALTIVAGNLDMDMTMSGLSPRNLFRCVRAEILGGTHRERFDQDGGLTSSPGLPDSLFLDATMPSLGFYFVGYLYIKAIQAHWSRLCPEMTDSAMFLPVVVRVICDHPLIEDFLGKKSYSINIIDRIHERLSTISAVELCTIAKLLRENKGWRDLFDLWDSAPGLTIEQLAEIPSEQGRAKVVERFLSPGSYFGGDPGDPWMNSMCRLRGASGVFLYEWHTGIIRNSTDKYVIMKQDNGEEFKGIFAFWGRLVDGNVTLPSEDPEADPETVLVSHLVEDLEGHFSRSLQDNKGRRATIAHFYTITYGIPGNVLWIEGKMEAVVPYGRRAFADYDREGYMIGEGLTIGPEERTAFAEAFVDGSDLKRDALAHSRQLLATLVSNEADQARLLRDRFNPYLRRAGQLSAFREWLGFSLWPQSPPEGAIKALDPIFDFPRFPPTAGPRIGFAELLPSLVPYTPS